MIWVFQVVLPVKWCGCILVFIDFDSAFDCCGLCLLFKVALYLCCAWGLIIAEVFLVYMFSMVLVGVLGLLDLRV